MVDTVACGSRVRGLCRYVGSIRRRERMVTP
jgi:hypothetical protein